MKNNIQKSIQGKAIALKLAVVPLMLMYGNGALANGTAAGTSIETTSSVTYKVDEVEQAAAESTASFIVDQKIDLTVAGGSIDSPTLVIPGATGKTVTYTVTNEGNATQDFQLTLSHDSSGDHFDIGTGDATSTPCAFSFTQPDGTTVVEKDLGTNAIIEDLKHTDGNNQITVTVTCDVQKSGLSNGDSSVVDLLALALDTDGNAIIETSTENTSGIDIVFADGKGTSTDGALGNAKHSATQTFQVTTSELSAGFTKTATIVWDPVNGTTNPKYIPGAIVEYTIQLTNNDDDNTNGTSKDITDLELSDSLNDNVSFLTNGTFAFTDPDPSISNRHNVSTLDQGSYTTDSGILLSFDNSTWTALTNASGDSDTISSKTVSANYSDTDSKISLAVTEGLKGGDSPETLYLKFRVLINSAPDSW